MSDSSTKVDFFDDLASRWDSKLDLQEVHERLVHALKHFGIQPTEHIMDVGCGTGNLTGALLTTLGPSGRIMAIDISPAMVAQAQSKINDPRISWHVADAMQIPCADSSIDRIMCYQVWPHFNCPAGMAQECLRVLKSGGQLHIWHTDSREKINHIHTHIQHPEIAADVLLPAEETAQILKDAGLVISHASESDTHYLVSAYKV